MTLLLALLLAQSGEPQKIPFPRDAFTYPGDPGTTLQVERYQKRWDKVVAGLPPSPPGVPSQLKGFEWLVGSWDVVVRDYEGEAKNGRGIVELARGTATIAFTPGGKWLRIETSAPNFYMVRYVGYDRVAKRLVLRSIVSPGEVESTPARSTGWAGDRVTFGPLNLLYYGLPLTDRIVFVRESNDRLRMVTEGRLDDGRWVAFDDIIYTRARD